ncbi:hypothetical protein B0T25DRAFT_353375 [Lasiosphaeria hispida]|uniref:Uncharacterized protein n=1 Tax=Lasiosphaeria hispida TaxID=260671 RepID=A0AAJ0H722_9PEZI|nr:hypothetical protein B0T25DRAFT_353375 [Lasiosphaeria hispida]
MAKICQNMPFSAPARVFAHAFGWPATPQCSSGSEYSHTLFYCAPTHPHDDCTMANKTSGPGSPITNAAVVGGPENPTKSRPNKAFSRLHNAGNILAQIQQVQDSPQAAQASKPKEYPIIYSDKGRRFWLTEWLDTKGRLTSWVHKHGYALTEMSQDHTLSILHYFPPYLLII